MAATRYGYVVIYNKPRHVVGYDTTFGHVEVQAGVQLVLYEGQYTTDDFASAVAALGRHDGLAVFPAHTGTIGRSFAGSVTRLLLHYITLLGVTSELLKCTSHHTIYDDGLSSSI